MFIVLYSTVHYITKLIKVKVTCFDRIIIIYLSWKLQHREKLQNNKLYRQIMASGTNIKKNRKITKRFSKLFQLPCVRIPPPCPNFLLHFRTHTIGNSSRSSITQVLLNRQIWQKLGSSWIPERKRGISSSTMDTDYQLSIKISILLKNFSLKIDYRLLLGNDWVDWMLKRFCESPKITKLINFGECIEITCSMLTCVRWNFLVVSFIVAKSTANFENTVMSGLPRPIKQSMI